MGKHQSPINIEEHIVLNVHLSPLIFSGMEIPRSTYLINNGHTGKEFRCTCMFFMYNKNHPDIFQVFMRLASSLMNFSTSVETIDSWLALARDYLTNRFLLLNFIARVAFTSFFRRHYSHRYNIDEQHNEIVR